MLTTVIIPIYNRAEMLFQALQSLRSQTDKEFCVIVYDNASQENLKSVVEHFKDLNIEYYQNDIHVAPIDNFIRAAKLCKTDFLKILCSDDLLFPTALAEQVKALQASPQAAICLGGIVQFRYQEPSEIVLLNYLSPYIPPARTEKQWGRLEECISYDPSSSLYRTELFNQIGGLNPGLECCDDWEIFIALSFRYPVVAVDEPICAMRLHAAQIGQNLNLDGPSIINDIMWMTSKANPLRTRLGLPLTQQIFIRQDVVWRELRLALISDQVLPSLKKWLKIIASNRMILTFFLGFPIFALTKIIRKPQKQPSISLLPDREKYKQMISSLLSKDYSYRI